MRRRRATETTTGEAPVARRHSGWWLGLLVMAATVVALELVRTTGPVLDQVYAMDGLGAAAGASLVTYLLPAALLLLAAALTRGRHADRGRLVVPVLVGCLVVVRLLAQGIHGGVALPMGAVALGVAVAVAAVTLACARPGGGRLAAVALAAGMSVNLALQLALTTWDAYWREGPLGWAVSAALLAVLCWATLMVLRDPACGPQRRPGRVWVLGPLFGLATLTVGSAAFMSSQTGLSLRVAGPLAVLAWLAAATVAGHDRTDVRTRVGVGAASAVMLVSLAAALTLADGPLSGRVLVTVAACLCPLPIGLLLTPALEGRTTETRNTRLWTLRTAGAAAVAGLATILTLLLYQIDYDTPLGFPNEVTPLAAAALVGVAALGAPLPVALSAVTSRTLPLVAFAAALGSVATGIGAVTAATTADTELDERRASRAGEVRVLAWNVHYGVSATGRLDVDALVDTVERHDPDVVLLNEVSRGWVIGGAADLGTLLEDRLGGHYAFNPAADRQFGNAIVARWPLGDLRAYQLPYGVGPQHRSALAANLRTPSGELGVVAVHLQQGKERFATRLLQLETLLPALAADPAESMVFGGDLNARVGDQEIAEITRAGWVSAVDEVGDPTAATIPSVAPTARYDWVFGLGVRFTDARVLTREQASDHLPVLVTLRLPGGARP